jgi:hypothetical protein
MDDDDAPSRGSTLSPAINKEKNIYITPRTYSSFPSRGCNRLRFKTFLPRPGNTQKVQGSRTMGGNSLRVVSFPKDDDTVCHRNQNKKIRSKSTGCR